MICGFTHDVTFNYWIIKIGLTFFSILGLDAWEFFLEVFILKAIVSSFYGRKVILLAFTVFSNTYSWSIWKCIWKIQITAEMYKKAEATMSSFYGDVRLTIPTSIPNMHWVDYLLICSMILKLYCSKKNYIALLFILNNYVFLYTKKLNYNFGPCVWCEFLIWSPYINNG